MYLYRAIGAIMPCLQYWLMCSWQSIPTGDCNIVSKCFLLIILKKKDPKKLKYGMGPVPAPNKINDYFTNIKRYVIVWAKLYQTKLGVIADIVFIIRILKDNMISKPTRMLKMVMTMGTSFVRVTNDPSVHVGQLRAQAKLIIYTRWWWTWRHRYF